MKMHTPNPQWKPGDPIPSPVQEMVSLTDLDALGSTAVYKILIGAVVPRPIAFVSTVNEKGVGNLAPFSFFNAVASNPASVVFSVTRKGTTGEKKDTLLNIEKTKQFVVNTVSDWLVEPMNQCSAEYPYGVDEMKKVGLTPLPSVKVKPPRVKESPVHMECELYGTYEVGEGGPGSATLVIGRIVAFHIYNAAYDAQNGRIKLEELQPLARLAGFGYSRIGGVFDLPRPKA